MTKTKTRPGVYTPLEYIHAVCDKDGRPNPKKEDALYKKHGEDVSINGPPGIGDQILWSIKNGFIFAGEETIPGTTMSTLKWVRDPQKLSENVDQQKLQRDMKELKITDPKEQFAYSELMRMFREENGRSTQDYYGIEAHSYGSKKARAALQKKFDPILKQVPPMPYGHHNARETTTDGDMLMNAVHTPDKGLALKLYKEMCGLADEVILMKWMEVFAQPGSYDHQTLSVYEKKAE